jgi:hypothetical protein
MDFINTFDFLKVCNILIKATDGNTKLFIGNLVKWLFVQK